MDINNIVNLATHMTQKSVAQEAKMLVLFGQLWQQEKLIGN